MNSDIRRVTVFFTVGLLVAVAVGIGVWRMGAPSAVTANPTMTTQSTAETTPRTTSHSEDTENTTTNRPPRGGSSDDDADAAPVPDYSNDPFLAPNSVINPQGQATTTTPTNVYRPEPIFGEQQQPQYEEPAAPVVTPESETPTESDPSGTTPGSETATSPQPPTSDDDAPTSTRPNYTDGDNDRDEDNAGGLPSPSEPTEPLEPTEPGEPGEPSEPTEPTEPTDEPQPSEEPEESENPGPTFNDGASGSVSPEPSTN
ncbi:hypothetical protein ACG98H_08535 [Corynebacterium sp. L4756]|uniref:hypothetical protein n=1 Tax=unclassified Corynebacterium TaxID=2624378 RepID=UPI00374D8F31